MERSTIKTAGRRASAVIAVVIGVVAAIVPVTSARAAGSSEIEICAGNAVSTVAADGTDLSAADLEKVTRAVENICAQGSSASQGNFAASTYYNVEAVASYVAVTQTMGASAYANSLPYGYYELSCIYRNEPVTGAGGTWLDCGVVGGNGTSFTTRGNYWCPPIGTRIHVHAALYDSSGTVLNTDDAWAVAY